MKRLTMNQFSIVVVILVVIGSSRWCLAYNDQCGKDVGGALCGNGLCCSKWGYCGLTNTHCGEGCQSQCTPPPAPPHPPLPEEYLISRKDFDTMLMNRESTRCEGKGFYTYEAFIEAALSFPKFGNEGNSEDSKKRDVAAFLAQTSQETIINKDFVEQTFPALWGYCYVTRKNGSNNYCKPSSEFPCAVGKEYYSRGPFQIRWNELYGKCGKALGVDLLNNPDLVAIDPVISFKTAIWFWMTPPPPLHGQYIPSAHDVITSLWTPTALDLSLGRFPSYGTSRFVMTYALKIDDQCGLGYMTEPERYGTQIYRVFCGILDVDPRVTDGEKDGSSCYKIKTQFLTGSA